MDSIFKPHDLETMNEDDVSGELVRPLCHALGYTQGHPISNLRSQFPLQYNKFFLGHRDDGKDPVIRGKPDFVCEVVSFARWVVEAKSPKIKLSLTDSQQAHTYATHPEIGAEFYMLCNGREFRLYRVGNPNKPVLVWLKDETDANLPALRNILGPDAMRKRASPEFNLRKPIAIDIGAEVEVLGGVIAYTKTTANVELVQKSDGMNSAVIGNRIYRNDAGLIIVEIDLRGPVEAIDKISRSLGQYPLIFSCADEYISSDFSRPTLLQNVLDIKIPRGKQVEESILSPAGIIPFDIEVRTYTQALGFINGTNFKGTFFVDYNYDSRTAAALFGAANGLEMTHEGNFDIKLR